MRVARLLLALAFLVRGVSVCQGASDATHRREDLPNFHQVDEHLYRGGQPDTEGLKQLAQLGVRTIIDLRGESRRAMNEQAMVERLGMRYLSVPLPAMGGLNETQVQRVLQVVEGSANWPVFLHCLRGSDRTGAIVACYRIAHDHWSPVDAEREAERYGLSRIQVEKKRFILRFTPPGQLLEGGSGPALKTSGSLRSQAAPGAAMAGASPDRQ